MARREFEKTWRIPLRAIGRGILSLAVACLVAKTLPAGEAKPAGKGSAGGKPPESVVDPLAQKINRFGENLYRKLSAEKNGANLVFSPFSIAECLLMLSGGTKDESRAQLAAALGLTGADAAVLAKLRQQLCGTAPGDDRFRLNSSNSLWAAQGFLVNPDFLSYARQNFAADCQLVPFRSAPAAACKTINDWLSNKTDGMIPGGLTPQSTPPDTLLLLCNAVYFNARWATEFPKDATKIEDFHRYSRDLPGTYEEVVNGVKQTVCVEFSPQVFRARVRMMHLIADFAYQAGKDFQAVKLPYANGQFSMIVVLPQEERGDEFETLARVWPQHAQWFQKPRQLIALGLPRFDEAPDVNLTALLPKLGVTQIFDRTGKAGLGGICNDPRLYVSGATHFCRVEVNEERTRAAAVTTMTEAPACIPPKPVPFLVNRTFLFLIRHEPTKLVLFVGRIRSLPSIEEPKSAPSPAPASQPK